MDNENYEDVSLELGAIIKLVSETNTNFHNKYFLIDYLDNEKIIIVGENKKTLKLTIKDGAIEDTSITQIIVVENSNSSKCKELLEKKYSNVKVILSEKNLNFSKKNTKLFCANA